VSFVFTCIRLRRQAVIPKLLNNLNNLTATGSATARRGFFLWSHHNAMKGGKPHGKKFT
jgi:hypothetical protein